MSKQSEALELADRLEKEIKEGNVFDIDASYFAAAELRRLSAIEAAYNKIMAQEPKFWYRPVGNDGLYEGPVHNDSIGGKMLRDEKHAEWKPLYTLEK